MGRAIHSATFAFKCKGDGANRKPRIVVVDDDHSLLQLVGGYLSRNNMDVELACSGKELDRLMDKHRPDLLVLDLMMPDEDGISIIRRLRSQPSPAIIMLSALGDDLNRVIGLDEGADDYVAKPCNPRELLARIHAVLRRQQKADTGPLTQIRFGQWTLDIMERTLVKEGDSRLVSLTDAEFRVLSALLEHPNKVLSRDELLDVAHGLDADVFDRAIDVTVSRLRRKIGEKHMIETLRNEGYMMTCTPERIA